MESIKKPYGCELCNKHFVSNSKLVCHIRSHTGFKPFSCKKCGKKFSQFSHVKRHDEDIHVKTKRHKCKECNKQFSQFNNLKLHKKIHQRPIYLCKICNKQYKSHKCFNKHIIKNH